MRFCLVDQPDKILGFEADALEIWQVFCAFNNSDCKYWRMRLLSSPKLIEYLDRIVKGVWGAEGSACTEGVRICFFFERYIDC